MADNKVSEMFASVTSNFKSMIDANTVVGEPMTMPDGTMIIPISNVSFGFGGGGSEFDSKKTDDTRFGGGLGVGASVKAEAFLVINNGNVRIISMDGGSSPMNKLVDLMPGMIDKVNGFVVDRKEKKAAKRTAQDMEKENLGEENVND